MVLGEQDAKMDTARRVHAYTVIREYACRIPDEATRSSSSLPNHRPPYSQTLHSSVGAFDSALDEGWRKMMEWYASIFEHFRINIQHVEGTHPTYRNRLHEHLTLSVLPNRQAYAHAEMGVLTRSSTWASCCTNTCCNPPWEGGPKAGKGKIYPKWAPNTWYGEP